QARLPHLEVTALVDKNGMVANTARTWPPPSLDLSDREYFKYHQRNPSSDLFISELLVNRATKERNVFMTKRIHGPDGEFLGVVLMGVKLSYFQHIYNSITSTRNQSFLFLRNDGTVLVRHPDPQQGGGYKIPADSPWHALIASGG